MIRHGCQSAGAKPLSSGYIRNIWSALDGCRGDEVTQADIMDELTSGAEKKGSMERSDSN